MGVRVRIPVLPPIYPRYHETITNRCIVIEADWGDYNGKGSLAKVCECLDQAADRQTARALAVKHRVTLGTHLRNPAQTSIDLCLRKVTSNLFDHNMRIS